MKVTIYCHLDYVTIERELDNVEQLQKARLQDEVARAVALVGKRVVFHGGTGIWRCYSGRRFSRDFDLYIWKERELTNLLNRLSQADLRVFKGRMRRYTYYTVSNGVTEISLQINERRVNGILRNYEMTDGSFIALYILDPLSLFREKLETYADRREERDLYDIMVLTRQVDKAKVKQALAAFLSNIKEPKDRGVLKGLVYGEAKPSFEELVDYLKRWVKE